MKEIQNEMHPVVANVGGIFKLLSSINPSKSAGPDGIPGRVLKVLAFEIASYLELLFNQILEKGEVPEDWRTANVVPIPKPGDKHCAENYRPISLTCIISRIFEHILHCSVTDHLRINDLLMKNQHGFRKGLSCETQLVDLFHDLSSIMDQRLETDIVFLDFKKAFDRVPHCHLITKLRSVGVHENVIAVVKSFLSGRTQKVVVDGTQSAPASVPSGVPQGSVLGPLLFLIFINDLGENISSQIRFFADDCCLYRPIRSEQDQNILQNDLNKVMEWCNKWGMELNFKKCVSMTVTRLHSATNRYYYLNDTVMDKVNSYKYLGVIISSNLSWNEQVNSVVLKASRSLGFVRRNISSCRRETKLQCYKSLVRPHLEYAVCGWDPFLASHIHLLEMTQRRAARFICNRYDRTASVTEMLEDLELHSLQKRRQIARIKLFYKVDSNGLPQLNGPPDLIRKPINGRSDNGKAYQHYICRTNPYFSSFYPRTVRDWNHLGSEAVFSPSLCSLSNKLKKVL